MKVINPKSDYKDQILNLKEIKIFLAGSIELGFAKHWQKEIISKFEGYEGITFLNPRNESFEGSVQSISDDKFSHQVNWELNHLELCDYIFLFLDGNTKSPVSLIELGLFAKSKKLIVVCEKEFWRRGNVEILCARESIPLYSTLKEGINHLKTIVKKESLFCNI